jgi:methylenetetrahydrofolate reductase (NADPH)
MQAQNIHPRTFSFEFFPPRTPEAAEKLRGTCKQLAQLGPKFFSVTYGAGGSTRQHTLEAVQEIRAGGQRAAPHISCIGSTRENIRAVLEEYRSHGIRHTVALRGDLPSGTIDVGEFRYANELVSFIRKETGDYFHIEVACYPEVHPQAKSARDDLLNFKRKIDAGANSAITQYFFNADSYFNFVDECAAVGIDVPIVPGIMPISNFSQLLRFSDNGDDRSSVRAFGLELVTSLCDRLLSAGAPGLHFYTLNMASLTSIIWQRLGLEPHRDEPETEEKQRQFGS